MNILNILNILIGGGILAFVEFFIKRHDEKSDKNSVILQAIDRLDKKIITLEDKIDKVQSNEEERDAVSKRVRILRFADEMMDNRRHSKECFDQVLSDITDYERYCSTHPDFKNNQTSATVEYITKSYAERLKKHDFL